MSTVRNYREGVQAALAGFYASANGRRLEDLEAKRARESRPVRTRVAGSLPTEYHEQKIVCQWLRAHGVDFFAVPNGARRDPVRGAQERAIGLSSGVPDLIIVTPPPAAVTIAPRGYAARVVTVEMKRSKGGRISPEQAAWGRTIERCGGMHFVAHGADAAIAWLTGLGYG